MKQFLLLAFAAFLLAGCDSSYERYLPQGGRLICIDEVTKQQVITPPFYKATFDRSRAEWYFWDVKGQFEGEMPASNSACVIGPLEAGS
jgi:hypothetical protein